MGGRAQEAMQNGPDDRRLRILERTIDAGDQGIYLVQVAATTDEIQAAINRFRLDLVITFALLAMALIASSALQLRYGLAPLRQLQEGWQQSGAGRARRSLGDFSQDIAPLASELNLLIGANRAVVERARTQDGNLAHALKTPLSVIINEASSDSDPSLQQGAGAGCDHARSVAYYLDRARAAVIQAQSPAR